jgi:Inner membrane protein YgaP-like, transmembrane domain
MIRNMGLVDRILRVLVAVVIAVLYISGIIGGTLAVVLGLIAVVFVVTSSMGFCPGYLPFKINTGTK